MRKAKIIATIGPASESSSMLRKLVKAGVDVIRLNFSHSTHDWHKTIIKEVRKIAEDLDRSIAILGDLQGPKLRTGELKDGKKVLLKKGKTLIITTDEIKGDENCVSTTYKELPADVKKGDTILLSDGLIALKVIATAKTEVKCTIINGGELGEHKGINLPGIKVSSPSLTDKDKEDLEFCLQNDVDYIALSFVRKPSDITDLKKIIADHKKNIPVIAKIEKPEALDNIDDILKASNGIMVARGDLGVEMSPECVPVIQKRLIYKAAKKHKIVITATQMLESMIINPRPTRAEASDVANAIMDGTDAIMLSAETAAGSYPVESVKMMAKIAQQAEQSHFMHKFENYYDSENINIALAVADAANMAVMESGAKSIIVFTETGATALLISKIRPSVPIIAFTPNEDTYKRLSLYWGVKALVLSQFGETTDELIFMGEKIALENRLLRRGDNVVVIAGTTPLPGSTNMMKVLKVGAWAH